MVFMLKDIMKKLLFITILTSIFTLSWGQCLPQCSNSVQNSSFTNSWSNWTKQSGWGISSYGGNSTSAVNFTDNSPVAGYSITQVINNIQGTKVFRLQFDAYPQSPNPGTSYLDFYLDNTKFVRLSNSISSTSSTYSLLNGAEGVSVSNLTFSSWKRGFSVNIPWVSNDSSVTLKIVFISNGSLRDWGVDNISLCRFQTLDLKDVRVSQTLDKIHFSFVKNADDVVSIYEFNEKTGKSRLMTTTTDLNVVLEHTSKYYLVVSDGYSRYFGPFSIVAEEPRRTLSIKQLLGQVVD
jgi:hypothetical protein